MTISTLLIVLAATFTVIGFAIWGLIKLASNMSKSEADDHAEGAHAGAHGAGGHDAHAHKKHGATWIDHLTLRYGWQIVLLLVVVELLVYKFFPDLGTPYFKVGVMYLAMVGALFAWPERPDPDHQGDTSHETAMRMVLAGFAGVGIVLLLGFFKKLGLEYFTWELLFNRVWLTPYWWILMLVGSHAPRFPFLRKHQNTIDAVLIVFLIPTVTYCWGGWDNTFFWDEFNGNEPQWLVWLFPR